MSSTTFDSCSCAREPPCSGCGGLARTDDRISRGGCRHHRFHDLQTRLFLLHVRHHHTFASLADEHLELLIGLERDGPEALRAHLRASAAMVVDSLLATEH